jgi:tetratricopeptide (TPR) repeat protein
MLQDLRKNLSRAVVDKLKVVFPGRAGDSITNKPHTNIEGYELYLKGRYHWDKCTEESLKHSVDLFKRAIALDSNYAPAYAGLADSYVAMSLYGVASPADVMPLAKEATERSLGLDAKSAPALNALGCVRAMYAWDWDAEADFKSAIELDPNNANVHQSYAGNYLTPLSRFAEARMEVQLALKLDPMSPAANVMAGALSYYARRYDDAIHQLLKTAEFDPSFAMTQYFLGQTYTERGAYADAVSALRFAEKLSGRSPEVLAALGYAHARAGEPAEACSILATLSELSKQRYVSPVLLGQVAVGLGDKGGALNHLREGLKVRATDLIWIGVKPVFDELRTDRDFAALCSQIFLIG